MLHVTATAIRSIASLGLTALQRLGVLRRWGLPDAEHRIRNQKFCTLRALKPLPSAHPKLPAPAEHNGFACYLQTPSGSPRGLPNTRVSARYTDHLPPPSPSLPGARDHSTGTKVALRILCLPAFSVDSSRACGYLRPDPWGFRITRDAGWCSRFAP